MAEINKVIRVTALSRHSGEAYEFEIIHEDNGTLSAVCEQSEGGLNTCGDTWDDLMSMIDDCIDCWEDR